VSLEKFIMSIAISGQYVFRRSIGKGTVRGGSQLVGIVYPDTKRGPVFAPAPGESFTARELFEITESVRNMAFSGVRRERKAVRRG
jgi:hypothetical protein